VGESPASNPKVTCRRRKQSKSFQGGNHFKNLLVRGKTGGGWRGHGNTIWRKEGKTVQSESFKKGRAATEKRKQRGEEHGPKDGTARRSLVSSPRTKTQTMNLGSRLRMAEVTKRKGGKLPTMKAIREGREKAGEGAGNSFGIDMRHWHLNRRKHGNNRRVVSG